MQKALYMRAFCIHLYKNLANTLYLSHSGPLGLLFL